MVKKEENAIVIGDIHGCYHTLVELYNKLPKGCPIYSVGDLCDRGLHTKLVIDFVIEKNIKPVNGNHEVMMLDILRGSHLCDLQCWAMNGGLKTIQSYQTGTEASFLEYEIPKEHEEFLENLPLFIEIEGYVISHAGFGLNVPKDMNYDLHCDDSIVWYRGPLAKLSNGVQIVGHTINEEPIIEDHYIRIDTGAFKGNKLTAIEIPSKRIYQVDTIKEDILCQV